YTIAMLILESGLFDHGQNWDLRVYGSDLSKKCIAAARRGVYGAASFRSTPDSAKRKWFTCLPGEAAGTAADSTLYGVSADARALCHFAQMSLLDEERTHLVGRCDVIFCRNVVLYFDAAARRRVIEMFYERLVPGGVLLMGHA